MCGRGRMNKTQPALRAIPDAGTVARILADAAENPRQSKPVIATRAAAAVAAEIGGAMGRTTPGSSTTA